MPRKRAPEKPANLPPPPMPPKVVGPRRGWFVYFINGRTSKFAHNLALYWTCPADGSGTALCGVNPYDYAPDVDGGALTVGFMEPGDAPHCSECHLRLQASEDVDVRIA